MYFLLLTAAAVLFSTQFLFNQKFEAECGSSLSASMLFAALTSVGGFTVLFALNRFKLAFSWYSMILAGVYALVNILYTTASAKAFETVNLSVYSMFAMLGGMLLPAVYGVIFANESITVPKIVSCVLITVSLFLSVDFKPTRGNKLYYAAVFVLNGLVGVISAIHQSNTEWAVDSISFLMLSRIFGGIISGVFCLSKNRIRVTKKSVYYAFGFAVFCCIGNLLVLISLKHLPASVQYPIITGGVMVISLVISVIRKEKVGFKNYASTVIALISTVSVALS